MAAALLAHRLSEAKVKAKIRSAGVLTPGQPVWPQAAEAMAERGLDLSGHRSRRLKARHVTEADLVLGMAREHVREAVVLDPLAFGRSFTIKELVRKGESMPRVDRPFDNWLSVLCGDRTPTDLLGASDLDDVDDPIGSPLESFRETASELDDLVARLVRVAWA